MLLEKYEYSTVSPGTKDYLDYLALRHEVFCDELQRVPSAARQAGPLRLESDDYDVHSLHVLCRSIDSGQPVACSRLILPGPCGLNVGARYTLSVKPDGGSVRIGEIGRLALSHRLRRYRSPSASDSDEICVSGDDSGGKAARSRAARAGLRDGPAVTLGLYRELLRLACTYGLTHCYAAMEPALARLLNRLGFPLHEAGPLNTTVHPARQPYVIGGQDMRSGLASRNACLYQFMFGSAEILPVEPAAAWQPISPQPAPLLTPPRPVRAMPQYPQPRRFESPDYGI